MVEQLFCKQQVVGSNPTVGSKIIGRLAEWFKAKVLKTVTPSASSRLIVNKIVEEQKLQIWLNVKRISYENVPNRK